MAPTPGSLRTDSGEASRLIVPEGAGEGSLLARLAGSFAFVGGAFLAGFHDGNPWQRLHTNVEHTDHRQLIAQTFERYVASARPCDQPKVIQSHQRNGTNVEHTDIFLPNHRTRVDINLPLVAMLRGYMTFHNLPRLPVTFTFRARSAHHRVSSNLHNDNVKFKSW